MSDSQEQWYVIYSPSPHGERLVQSAFHRRGQKALLWIPMCKVNKVSSGQVEEDLKPLFPQYIFVKTDMSNSAMEQELFESRAGYFLKAPGATRPTALTEKEIFDIKASETHVNDKTEEEKNIKVGCFVDIVSGPFLGFKGVVTGVHNGKVDVETFIFGRSTPVQIQMSELLATSDNNSTTEN